MPPRRQRRAGGLGRRATTAEARTEVAAAAGRSACGDCRGGGKDGLGERLRHRSTPARATAAEKEAGEGGGGCLGSGGGGRSGQAPAAAAQQRKKRVEEEAEVVRWGRHRMEIR